MAFGCREKNWIALGVIHNVFHAVTNTMNGIAPHMSPEDSKYTPCQVMVRNVCHPKASCNRIQATFVRKDIAEGPPVKSKEVFNCSAIKTWEDLACDSWIAKRDSRYVSSTCNGHTINNKRLRQEIFSDEAVAIDVDPGLLQINTWPWPNTLEIQVDAGYIYYLDGTIKPSEKIKRGRSTWHRTLRLVPASSGRRQAKTCNEKRRAR